MRSHFVQVDKRKEDRPALLGRPSGLRNARKGICTDYSNSGGSQPLASLFAQSRRK